MPVDAERLREEVRKVYSDVVRDPKRGYHFHTGPAYAVERLGYAREALRDLPDSVTAPFAGVGNPLAMGGPRPGLTQIEYVKGLAESLPVSDGVADLVISNGVINLTPDKAAVFREAYRALKVGGRLQIADIVVHKDIPPAGREDIAIWTA
jgi:SAM-dependent methyltransferase